MPRVSIPAVSALAGGVLWLLYAALGGTGLLAGVLHLIGWWLFLVAAAAFGSSLIRAGGTVQRIFVGVASAIFLLLLIESFRSGGTVWYDAGWGAAAVVVGGVALLRRESRRPPPGCADGTRSGRP